MSEPKRFDCPQCGKNFSMSYMASTPGPRGGRCITCEKLDTDFVKYDKQKIRMDLIPPSFLTSTAAVLTYGSIKYDDNNWMKCPKWSRYYGALLRHLVAILGGEVNDPESGLPHLWHLNCNAAFLTEFQEAGIGEDDMPKRTYKNRDDMIAASFKKAKELHDEST